MDSLEALKAKKLIRVLQLKKKRDGHYQTAWGHKTDEGLVNTILAIMGGELSAKELME